MSPLLPSIVALAVALPAVTIAMQQTPAPTRVVRYAPPAQLPDRVKPGECAGSSAAADYRADAVRCRAGETTYDPCFVTTRADRVLCDVDPRDASIGVVITLPSPLPLADAGGSAPGARAWFFELTDGSTCRPLLGSRREVEGLVEFYTCKFGSVGDADAVMGELDASALVWTIQKTLINKKVDPQTIKSAFAAPVKTVWQ